jgi:hypothetical protein
MLRTEVTVTIDNVQLMRVVVLIIVVAVEALFLAPCYCPTVLLVVVVMK